MAEVPGPGQQLLVPTFPDHNSDPSHDALGADVAPATVTYVHKDGTVDLTVLLRGGRSEAWREVEVFADRAAAEKRYRGEVKDIPPRPDDRGRPVKPELSDLWRWRRVAFWPPAPAAPAPTPPGGGGQ